MNILDAIRDRQSIRSFKKEPIEREIVEKILNFAKFAPSGGNTQPWKVYVLNSEIMENLEKAITRIKNFCDSLHN